MGLSEQRSAAVMTTTDGLDKFLQVFYSAFQALLYAMCYHLEGIMQPQAQLPSGAHTQLSPAAQAITRLFQAVMPPLLSHW